MDQDLTRKIVHQHWDNPVEFYMTCVGFAVGLGNVWRFPYLCFQNGGCAFVIAFVIMLIFIGLPLFFLELTIAQYSKCGPLKVWKISPLFKGLGMAAVLTTTFVCIYYNIIIAYCVVFFVSSFYPSMPWVGCDHEWNNELCLSNMDVGANFTKNASVVYESPAYQYYYSSVLELSSGIDDPNGMNWKLVGSLFICWLLTFLSLSKGIQSLGKVSYVTAIFPYIMIIALIIRGATLPGAMKGISYYIGSLDMSKLLRLKTWIDAASQVCFCLSLAEGGLITLGKHNKFHFNHMKTSIFVVLLDGFTGLLAGFAIFSVLGFMADQLGVEVSELAVGGPGLSFIVYPEALSLMPFPWVWCVLFFAMMITIGFGSLLSLAECVLDSFIFFFNIQKLKYRMIFRFSMCMVFFLIGCSMATRGGYYLLVIIESYTTTIPIILMATLESIVLGWFYGVDRLKADIKLMLNIRLNMFWRICFAYITPIMSIAITIISIAMNTEITFNEYIFPRWAHYFGWCIVLFVLSPLVINFLYQLHVNNVFKEVFKLTQPALNWKAVFDEQHENPLAMTKSEFFELNIEADKFIVTKKLIRFDPVDV